MNKLELELDEKKVLADGEYNLDELYGYIDCIAVTEKGLRKEGNFYIEDDPVDDGFAPCPWHSDPPCTGLGSRPRAWS